MTLQVSGTQQDPRVQRMLSGIHLFSSSLDAVFLCVGTLRQIPVLHGEKNGLLKAF